ncbi:MAG: 2OG-Fe(II) oxygenase [Cyanobacteria bacterium HKST-UBA02]|nr:2OG-Fe(II) oxygenase [Cyanobacteria bacterium HKST-UBA02]
MDTITPASAVTSRLKELDRQLVCDDLDRQGFAVIEGLLQAEQARSLIALYDRDELFRKRIVMANHGYGRGEYKYFNYPLPDLVSELRTTVYPQLVELGNRWNETMKIPVRYPAVHSDFLARCHEAGQVRPTPLLLRYGADDFNCLHQDLYGEHVFPVQLAVLLSSPDEDFTGGEFIMTEQRPRMQTKPLVVPLKRGDGVIFAVHQRPVKGSRGYYRVNMRHGVSRIIDGSRHTLGIIFHDAK